MTAKKIGISLDPELYEWVRASVDAGRAESVSERIADVLKAERERDAWLAERERIFGALPDDPDADAYWAARLHRTPEQILAENAGQTDAA
jgi:Arc/MetJ-type ribon-helix-helix transcriptional regulator